MGENKGVSLTKINHELFNLMLRIQLDATSFAKKQNEKIKWPSPSQLQPIDVVIPFERQIDEECHRKSPFCIMYPDKNAYNSSSSSSSCTALRRTSSFFFFRDSVAISLFIYYIKGVYCGSFSDENWMLFGVRFRFSRLFLVPGHSDFIVEPVLPQGLSLQVWFYFFFASLPLLLYLFVSQKLHRPWPKREEKNKKKSSDSKWLLGNRRRI